MYEDFYKLQSRPFLSAPDPDFLFWAESHTLAFTMLRYGLMTRAPITVVTGEIGAGKTTLLRRLLREMPTDLVVGLISNMQADRGELLHWIFQALGIDAADGTYVQQHQIFRDFIIERYAEGKRVVLIFDEAQNLDVSTIEEIRMLSNINSEKDELLQIILVGQPELRDLISKPNLVQFAQRISADFHVDALNAKDTEEYIQHRLSFAGAKWRIFPKSTCDLIYQATGGVPRLINILCDMCLVYGFSSEKKVVEEDLLREFLNSAQKNNIFRQFKPIVNTPKLVNRA